MTNMQCDTDEQHTHISESTYQPVTLEIIF